MLTPPGAESAPASTPASTPLLHVDRLSVEFASDHGSGAPAHQAVNGVSLTIGEKEIVGLVGESGSGKTVLSLSLLRLIPKPGAARSGAILWRGRDLLALPDEDMRAIRGREIAMIFQNPQSSLNPVRTIGAQMSAVIRLHQDRDRAAARAEALDCLRAVKIVDAERVYDSYPHQCSGGMCQRIMIAMALACRPKLLIADEPTASLDVTIQAQIMDLLLEIRERYGTAILLVSHDLGVIARMCDRIAVMYRGRIVEEADALTLYRSPQHEYTRMLLDSVPVPDPTHRPARRTITSLSLILLACLMTLFAACSRPRKVVAPTAPELAILYNAEEQPSEKHAVMQIIQAQLRAKGIPVRLDPVSNTLYNERLARGDFQCTLNLWYVDYNDPEGYLTDFYSKAGYRTAKYESAEYDRLYLAGLRAPTDTEKLLDYRQALTLVDRELPWIPLYSNQELYLFRRGYEGYTSNAYQYYDYRRVAQPEIRAESDSEMETLDPALAYDVASKHIVTQSYEGLVALDDRNAIVPALAESWELSPARDTLTFHLRKGVMFHQHAARTHPLDSEDVRASFERLLKSTSPYTYIFNYVRGVDEFTSGKAPHVGGFRTPDASTFVIALKQPFPTMLAWLLAPAADILPRELPANYDFSQGSVGTGPFALASWDGVVARFTAHPRYWVGGEPMAKELSIRVMKDPNTALAAFRAGELDILNVPLAIFPEILDGSGRVRAAYREYGYREVKLLNLKFLAFNMQLQPWGSSLDLRQRVLAAINREAIARLLFRGKATVASSVMPVGFPGFD
jgi:peptide/nickel transport system ATP-binding protein